MGLIPEKLHSLFYKVIHSHASVKEVADGFAIGTFIAFLPIMGIQMTVSIFFTWLFKKNHWAGALAAWITNPLTFIPIYFFNYWVGRFFYSGGVKQEQVMVTLQRIDEALQHLSFIEVFSIVFSLGMGILVPLCIGSVIVGLGAAFIGRYLCLKYFAQIKSKFVRKNHET